MRNSKIYFTALAVTLAVILCVGGAVLLHQNTKQPEEYTGGTQTLDFAQGTAHTAGDAVFVPAPKDAVPEILGDDAVMEGGETDSEGVDDESDGEVSDAEKDAPDKSKAKGRKNSNAVLTSERPDDVWSNETNLEVKGYTPRTQLPSSDSIGTLKIPSIGLTTNAYDSANTMEDMDKGVSHFQSTSYWDGNVGLCGHNGNLAYSFFGKLHKVKVGDTITYTTELGTRSYTVSNIWTISDDDWSHLERTDDNRLTLITCVSDPAKRLCVQAVEQ